MNKMVFPPSFFHHPFAFEKLLLPTFVTNADICHLEDTCHPSLTFCGIFSLSECRHLAVAVQGHKSLSQSPLTRPFHGVPGSRVGGKHSTPPTATFYLQNGHFHGRSQKKQNPNLTTLSFVHAALRSTMSHSIIAGTGTSLLVQVPFRIQ